MAKPEFAITQHKGFHMEFENGWRVSVQFGPGNYGDHHMTERDYAAPSKAERWSSSQAEVAIFQPDGEFLGGDVFGYLETGTVAKLLHYVSKLQRDTTSEDALGTVNFVLSEDSSPLIELEIETRRG